MAVMMKCFGKVDSEGKIAIPKNLARQAGLTPGQLVEVKLVGAAHNGSRNRSVSLTAKMNTVS